MQINYVLALFSAVLAGSISASPAPDAHARTVRVQLANNHSGSNKNAEVPVNGDRYPVPEIWGNFPQATSVQLTADFQGVTCCVWGPGWGTTVNDQHTWANLKGGALVDVCYGYVSCS
ncbi:hypothetical protein VN97_g814 [Penicillium thymicola]|uniref:Uncharacterized protein n=1 Tax=Penicillium thymicola TaxID=293382 RepID=A0AAI9XD03_PENTH|nr:hypothetical protein VN97_g814 [Penicillium thymicola]